MSAGADGSARMAPLHCPYCADEDLRPAPGGSPETGAAWECRACARAFTLRFVGLSATEVTRP